MDIFIFMLKIIIINKVLVLISIILLFTFSNGAYADMTSSDINFPKTFENWTRSQQGKTINSQNIFKYMNGAGELYLSYRFDHLQVVEFKKSGQADILVEVYFMKSPEDAFGLLSLDWGGEPVDTDQTLTKTSVAPPHRSLYGAGLLRIAVDSIYVRILSNLETPEIRKTILSLGQWITKDRKACQEPKLLKKLPLKLGPDYTLQKDRIGYFRSYLVLNNMYYISHQNILNLNHSTNVVFAPYELEIDSNTKKKIQFLLIKYPDKKILYKALEQFHKNYLTEFPINYKKNGELAESNFYKIEDGFVGYKLYESYLTILFEIPDQQLAESMLKQIKNFK